MILKYLILFFVIEQNTVDSSYFYGGMISAKPIQDHGNGIVTLNFLIRMGYRRSSSDVTYCDENTIKNGTLIGHGLKILCDQNCVNSHEVVGTATVYCQAYSEFEDYSYGLKSFDYRAKKTDNLQVNLVSNDWMNLAIWGYRAKNKVFELRFTADLINRTDTKQINSPPLALIAPLIRIPQNYDYYLRIPNFDEDGDDTFCRYFYFSIIIEKKIR
jgi:hypothetical protein